MARALELAAAAAGNEVSSDDVWRAVSASSSGDEDWSDVAASAAQAIGLQPHRQGAVLELARGRPVVVRAGSGRWLVALGQRRRGRIDVVELDDRGETRRTLTPAELAAEAEGESVLRLEPLLALDPIAASRHPELAGRPWQRLRAFLELERRDLWVVVVYAVVVGALTLATPVAAQALVNTVAFGAVLQPVVVLSLLLFGGLAFAGLLTVFEAFVVEVLQRRVFIRVADDFGRRLPSVRREALDQRHAPSLVNRFFDVLTIQKTLAALLLDGLALALQTAIGMVLLGFYHPLLLAFDVVLVLLLVVALVAGRGAVRTGLEESAAKYRTAAWLEELSRVPHMFGGAAARRRAAQQTDRLCREYLRARKSHFRILLRQLTGGVGLQVLAMGSLLGVGGWLVIVGQLTLGQLVAAELVIAAIGAGFVKLGRNLEKLYDLSVGVAKLGDVVDLPVDRRGGEPLPAGGAAGVDLRDVELRRGDRPVLRGASVRVAAGERLRVTGATGSGKTTLLEGIAGRRLPADGTILVDGLDLRRADLASVRDELVFLRGGDLVEGTVLDNLGLGAKRPLLERDARAVLSRVSLVETIDALPEGLDTELLPGGAPLSDSQARRLALAAALAAQPRVLVLDRALDGLGLEGAAKDALLDAVLGPDAPWTAVVVTDDPDVAARCDRMVSVIDAMVEVAA